MFHSWYLNRLESCHEINEGPKDYLQSVLLAPPPQPMNSKSGKFHGMKHPQIVSSILAAPKTFVSPSEISSPVESTTTLHRPTETTSESTIMKPGGFDRKEKQAKGIFRMPNIPPSSSSNSDIWTLGQINSSCMGEPHLLPQISEHPQTDELQPDVVPQVSFKNSLDRMSKSVTSIKSSGAANVPVTKRGSHSFGVDGVFESVATELPPWPHITKRKAHGVPQVLYLP